MSHRFLLIALSVGILAALLLPGSISAQTQSITRDNPVPFGDVGQVGDYDIRVVSTTPDALDIVMAENQFNDPPADGNQFFMVRVEVTYTGNESGEAWLDLSFKSVGDRGVAYDSSSDCGVFPEQAYDLGELFPGATAEFNLCWEVTSTDFTNLVLFVDESFSFDSERVWFALNQEN